MKNIIGILILIAVLISCGSRSKLNEDKETCVFKVEVEKALPIDVKSEIDSFRFLILETSDSLQIGRISKILFHDDKMIITDAITKEKNESVQEAEVLEKIIKKKVTKEMYQKLIDVWCIENSFNEKDKTNRLIADKALKNKYIIEGEK